jgi:hypothetical protein
MISQLDLTTAFSELDKTPADKVQGGITRAYTTISRYIPSPVTGVLANQAIDAVALVLARAYISDKSAVSDEHPIVRDMKESLHWLEQVSVGKLLLPADPIEQGSELVAVSVSSVRVSANTAVFTQSVFDRMV